MKYEKYLRNTALGFLVGFCLAMLVTYLLDQAVWAKYEKYAVYLMSAGFSLFGAGLALIGVFANLERQNAIQAEIRMLKLDSARAFLPSALSQFAEICRVGIWDCYEVSQSGEIIEKADEFDVSSLFLSDENTRIFRDVVENCSDLPVRHHLSEVLRQHQLLVARTRPRMEGHNRVLKSEDYGHISHWAYLYALVGTLFPFARGESDSIQKPLEEFDDHSALHILGLNLDANSYANYSEHIATYAKQYLDNLT